MSQELNFESDMLGRLLTDALRAGPGSPQWHEATQRLTGNTSPEAREYRQILLARERLESGRNYRSVRAGPGFTRRLMSQLEREPAGGARRGWWIPPASLIAILSAMLVVGALAGIAYYLMPRAQTTASDAGATSGVDKLASQYLVETATSATFDTAELPAGWKPVGALRMAFARGMRPAPSAGTAAEPTTQTASGGIAWGQPFEPQSPFAIEVVIRAPRSGDELIPEVVVAEYDPSIADRASSNRELVWLLKEGRSSMVLPGGDVEAQSQRVRDLDKALTVRLTLDRTNIILEINGQRVWAGAHKLSSEKPRYAVLRFLKRGNDRAEPVFFQSVRIQRTAP
jgi:hypothetical protein